jgi:hypothetical protein
MTIKIIFLSAVMAAGIFILKIIDKELTNNEK